MNINPFQLSVAFHIEICHLICTANQMTGFYVKCKTVLKWVNLSVPFKANIWVKVFKNDPSKIF